MTEVQLGEMMQKMARREGHAPKLPGHFARIGVKENLSLDYLDYLDVKDEVDVLTLTFILRDAGFDHSRAMVINRLNKLSQAHLVNRRIGVGGRTFWRKF